MCAGNCSSGCADCGCPATQGIEGPKGDRGPVGPKPAHAWVGTLLSFENPDGTWGSLVDLKGDQGDQGDAGGDGQDGQDGEDGSDGKGIVLLSGVNAPSSTPAADDAIYLYICASGSDAFIGNLYQYNFSITTWVLLGNIRGPQGIPGNSITGDPGTDGDDGAPAPPPIYGAGDPNTEAVPGVEGQQYYDVDGSPSPDHYLYIGSVWTLVYTSGAGAQPGLGYLFRAQKTQFQTFQASDTEPTIINFEDAITAPNFGQNVSWTAFQSTLSQDLENARVTVQNVQLERMTTGISGVVSVRIVRIQPDDTVIDITDTSLMPADPSLGGTVADTQDIPFVISQLTDFDAGDRIQIRVNITGTASLVRINPGATVFNQV